MSDLSGARDVGLITRVTGGMEDVYGERLPVELVFEWAPWLDKLTQAQRRADQDPSRPIVKGLEAIEKELARVRSQLGRQQRQSVDLPPE